jgi:hypothetical protein
VNAVELTLGEQHASSNWMRPVSAWVPRGIAQNDAELVRSQRPLSCGRFSSALMTCSNSDTCCCSSMLWLLAGAAEAHQTTTAAPSTTRLALDAAVGAGLLPQWRAAQWNEASDTLGWHLASNSSGIGTASDHGDAGARRACGHRHRPPARRPVPSELSAFVTGDEGSQGLVPSWRGRPDPDWRGGHIVEPGLKGSVILGTP